MEPVIWLQIHPTSACFCSFSSAQQHYHTLSSNTSDITTNHNKLQTHSAMAGNRSPSIFRPTQSPSPQPRRSREDRLRTNLPPRVYYAPSQLAAVVDLTGSNAAYNTPRKRARTAKDSPNNTTNQPTGDGGSSVLPTAPPHQDPGESCIDHNL